MGPLTKTKRGIEVVFCSYGQFLQVRAIFPCTYVNLEGSLWRTGNVITSFGVPKSIIRQGQSVQV